MNTGNNERAGKYAKMACVFNMLGVAAIFIVIAVTIIGGFVVLTVAVNLF